jgi:colicin import membrane protein
VVRKVNSCRLHRYVRTYAEIECTFDNVRHERCYDGHMADPEQGTQVEQSPTTGGRARQYATGAERARAWRERQKLRRAEIGGTGTGVMDTPVLAEASLGVLLARLTDVSRAHETAMGELAGRVEDAVGALADPEAVAEALAAGRAEAARQVAEAEERAVRAAQARSAAEAAARDAIRSRSEAEQAAEGAWERAEALEADLTGMRLALDTARSDAAQEAERHHEEVAALRADHAEQLGQARRQADAEIADAREAAR